MSEIEVLRYVIGFATLIFAAEDWCARAALALYGPRAWAVQRGDYGRGIPRTLLDLVFTERGLTLILAARVAASIGLLVSPHAIDALVLIFGTWAWAVRWRGTFNGGSDTMTVIVLLGLFVNLVDPAREFTALAFVGAHLIVSFVLAGVAKLRNAEWRNGRAPRTFAADVGVQLGPRTARALAWTTMAFEISFPLGALHPHAAVVYTVIGVTFHVLNAYVFGLNRFLWAWLAAYPALFALAAR